MTAMLTRTGERRVYDMLGGPTYIGTVAEEIGQHIDLIDVTVLHWDATEHQPTLCLDLVRTPGRARALHVGTARIEPGRLKTDGEPACEYELVVDDTRHPIPDRGAHSPLAGADTVLTQAEGYRRTTGWTYHPATGTWTTRTEEHPDRCTTCINDCWCTGHEPPCGCRDCPGRGDDTYTTPCLGAVLRPLS